MRARARLERLERLSPRSVYCSCPSSDEQVIADILAGTRGEQPLDVCPSCGRRVLCLKWEDEPQAEEETEL